MSAIAPIENPADTSTSIHLKEATVEKALAYSNINPESEEVALTAFLNAVQEDEHYTDSKLWTAQVRTFALYWYCVNTQADTTRKFTYTCSHCDKKHVHEFDLKELSLDVMAITGKPYRDIDFMGGIVRVKPLDGSAMESLEVKRLELIPEYDHKGKALELTKDQKEANSHARNQLKLKRLLLSIEFPQDLEENQKIRDKNKEKTLAGITMSEYQKLQSIVFHAQSSMSHGLPCGVDDEGFLDISIGNAACTQRGSEDKSTSLRTRFHNEFSRPMV